MKKIITVGLLFAFIASGAFGESVMGKTADGFGCLACYDWMTQTYGSLSNDAHDRPFQTVIYGEKEIDLNGDGVADRLTVDGVTVDAEDEYEGSEAKLRLNIEDGKDGHVSSVVTDVPLEDIFNHTGEWTDTETREGPVYAVTRVYVWGDENYITAETNRSALIGGDGVSYSIDLYRYNGSTLEPVACLSDCASMPYVLDENVIRELAAIGIGNICFEDLWLGNGLIRFVPDPVPVAGIYVRAVSDDRCECDLFSVKDYYEENGESLKKICEVRVLSEAELNNGELSVPVTEEYDGWFALDANAYETGKLEITQDTQIRTLPTKDSQSLKQLKAGDAVSYAGFSMQNDEGKEAYCVLFDASYGFVDADSCVALEAA